MAANSGRYKCTKNEKLSTAQLAVTERRLSKLLSTLDDDYQRSSQKLRKETDEIKRELFQLKKQQGSLCASTLYGLEASPGIQDRYTRNKRFGCHDPALNKAVTDLPKDCIEEKSSTPLRKEILLKKAQEKLESVPMSATELFREEVCDPYKNRLLRMLNSSKLAKDIRSTSIKVKLLGKHCSKQLDQPKESSTGMQGNACRRQRIQSLPTSVLSARRHIDSSLGSHMSSQPFETVKKTRSLDSGLHPESTSFFQVHSKEISTVKSDPNPSAQDETKGRFRKRSTSLYLPVLPKPNLSSHRRKSDAHPG